MLPIIKAPTPQPSKHRPRRQRLPTREPPHARTQEAQPHYHGRRPTKMQRSLYAVLRPHERCPLAAASRRCVVCPLVGVRVAGVLVVAGGGDRAEPMDTGPMAPAASRLVCGTRRVVGVGAVVRQPGSGRAGTANPERQPPSHTPPSLAISRSTGPGFRGVRDAMTGRLRWPHPGP